MDYRARLYEQYLTTQVLDDPSALHQALRARRPYLAQLIRRCMPADRQARILELGCGFGAFLVVLQEAGFTRIEGVDASPEQVEAARTLGLTCVRRAGVEEVLRAAEEGSYDVIVAIDVLEHFTREELFPIVDGILRALAPRGRLVAHVPNGEGIFPGRIYFGDLSHQTCFTPQSIQQLLSVVGFGSIEVSEDEPVAHGIKSLVRRALWKVFRSFFRLIYASETGDSGSRLVLSQNLLVVAEKR